MRKTFATLFVTTAVAASFAVAPATSAPLVTGGLVNITITDITIGDVLSNNNVALGAALGIAANVCGVNVNVLARQLQSGDVTCTNTVTNRRVDITQA